MKHAYYLQNFLAMSALMIGTSLSIPTTLYGPDSQRELSSSGNGRLFFTILGQTQFCQKIKEDQYRTKSVRYLFVWLHKLFNPSDLSGSCESLCGDVCDHQECTTDFTISDDKLTCNCIRDTVTFCGTNTKCDIKNEECQCLVGYDGDPYDECFQESIVVSGLTNDLEVVKCNNETVEIKGVLANLTVPGGAFIYTTDDFGCAPCSPLFRNIVSIADGVNGTKVLTTTFATFGEILGSDIVVPAIQNELLEPVAGCVHSGNSSNISNNSNRMLYIDDIDRGSFPQKNGLHRQLQSFPNECSAWQSTNSDGRCTYTNCFVGLDGDPNDCFLCGTSCDNGCGAAGSSLNTDGNFLLFDFGPACCIHDHCYSSTFTKAKCDFEFYVDMISSCPSPIPFVAPSLLPLKVCATLATAFYLAVVLGGDDAADIAKKDQANYERNNPVCIAKCPTTQRSGGQGTTTLVIDLLRSSGSFPVSYQMYTIPDQLYITYEGTRIFDTGGLVSGGSSTNVRFSGTSTIIEATINAPTEGTAWDVFIGCPVAP